MIKVLNKYYNYYLEKELGLSLMFYILILSIFLIHPITHLEEWTSITYNFLIIVIFVFSVNFKRLKFNLFYKILLIYTFLNFIVYSIEIFHKNTINEIFEQVVFIFFIILAIIHYSIEMYKDRFFSFRRIQGGVIIYILLGVIYYKIYYVLYLLDSSNFIIYTHIKASNIRMNLFYFSFTTLTTVGFGDIAANSPLSKPFVITEALIGQLYPVIYLARIVTLEIEAKKTKILS
jgi:hypothetical protein